MMKPNSDKTITEAETTMYAGLRGPATGNADLISRGKAVPGLLADFDRLKDEKSALEAELNRLRKRWERDAFELGVAVSRGADAAQRAESAEGRVAELEAQLATKRALLLATGRKRDEAVSQVFAARNTIKHNSKGFDVDLGRLIRILNSPAPSADADTDADPGEGGESDG